MWKIIKIRIEISEVKTKKNTKNQKNNRRFFEKMSKIDRSLGPNSQKKSINRIRNEQVNITTVTKEIQSILKKYFKYLLSIKLENLKKNKMNF